MDNHSSTVAYRPSSPVASPPANKFSRNPILSTHNNLKLVFPFNIPPTLEASVSRIVTNLNYYKMYYTVFVWFILFIALLPKRKVSLIFLVGMTKVTTVYLMSLRWFPNSTILHQTIDKRLVLFFLLIGTMLGMILTSAALHFFATLVGTIPVILVHALLKVRFSLFVDEETCSGGGLVPIVYFVPFMHEKSGDYEQPPVPPV